MINYFQFQKELEELNKVVQEQPQTQEWRIKLSDMSEIYEEQCVDSLEQLYRIRHQNGFEDWEQFKIMKVYKDILVLQQILNQKNIKVLGRWSTKIEKANTKNEEILKWKSSLAPGMKILAYDDSQFTESTILDIQTAQQATDYIELSMGYRVYNRGGDKEDEIGKFYGWSSKFDQWIPLYSPNIQPKLAFEVAQGNLEIVKHLLKKEGNASQIRNNKVFDDSILIHNACEGGKADIAEYLIQNQICKIEHRDQNGNTPLIIGVVNNHVDVIRMLLNNGAVVDLDSEDQSTIDLLKISTDSLKYVYDYSDWLRMSKVLKLVQICKNNKTYQSTINNNDISPLLLLRKNILQKVFMEYI
eukprot:403351644